jgi:hypothetical protein
MTVEAGGDMTWYKPSNGPGPVFKIAADGQLTVYKLDATKEELAKLFWEAVLFQGLTYNQKLQGCEQMIHTLMHDPARRILTESDYEIFKHAKDHHDRVPMRTVKSVMDAARCLLHTETN